MSHEDEPRYASAEFLGVIEGKDGAEGVAYSLEGSDNEIKQKLKDHMDEEMGVEGEYFQLLSDGKTGQSTFGFTNWKGSAWIPQGPKPNWITSDKKLN